MAALTDSPNHRPSEFVEGSELLMNRKLHFKLLVVLKQQTVKTLYYFTKDDSKQIVISLTVKIINNK